MGEMYSIKHGTEETMRKVRRKMDGSAAEKAGSSDATDRISAEIDEARLSMKGDYRGAGVYTSYYVTT